MYISFSRPLLEYGDIIWDNSSAANKRALENIQVEALRITTGELKFAVYKYCMMTPNGKLYRHAVITINCASFIK